MIILNGVARPIASGVAGLCRLGGPKYLLRRYVDRVFHARKRIQKPPWPSSTLSTRVANDSDVAGISGAGRPFVCQSIEVFGECRCVADAHEAQAAGSDEWVG